MTNIDGLKAVHVSQSWDPRCCFAAKAAEPQIIK
jgi:hypothetical protein